MNASGFTAQAAPQNLNRPAHSGVRQPFAEPLACLSGLSFIRAGIKSYIAACCCQRCRAALVQRSFRIEVADAGLAFHFTYDGQRFRAMQAQPEPDLCIRANAWDFHLLMQKAEDADTLFFSRRLTMTGDTELGVLIKNTLDALELPEVLPAPLRRFLQPQRRD
jgi:predicted lipid carrier protein YhbT